MTNTASQLQTLPSKHRQDPSRWCVSVYHVSSLLGNVSLKDAENLDSWRGMVLFCTERVILTFFYYFPKKNSSSTVCVTTHP